MNINEKNYIEKMVSKYSTKEMTKLDRLRELDRKSRKSPQIFAYVFGSISSLILGFGMCVSMEVILEGWMWLGILVGVLGIFLVSSNYFIYKRLIESSKNKYSKEILDLSNDLLNEDK